MTISNLYSLLFETTPNYEKNLHTLVELIKECDEHSFLVAGEVCLTGYDYDRFDAMLRFAPVAKEALVAASKNKTIILTMCERDEAGDAKNFAYVFSNGEIVRKQPKAKLFKFGDEHKYLAAGEESDIAIFEIEGVKIGILICFELRFKTLWQQLEGADIIAVPSWWGRLRTNNYVTLTNALAVMNQCYVVCSDNLHEECNAKSGIITPFGDELRNGSEAITALAYDPKEIKKMRRYMDVGIA